MFRCAVQNDIFPATGPLAGEQAAIRKGNHSKGQKMKFLKRKRRNGLPIATAAGVALGMGGLIWAYLRWFRPGGIESGSVPGDSKAGARAPGAEALAEKFQSLDSEKAAANIPKDLERDPKNIEQSIHPG